ncbi:MAG: phosphonate C-P lyase system protein PhnG [Allorhizobium sp.]
MDQAKQIQPDTDAGNPRKRVVDMLAQALREELDAAWETVDPKPEAQALRGPETGMVMIRGRIGGGGAPFNLGEATISRATVRLSTGAVGHGHTLGTDAEKARLAAVFDALWQDPDVRPLVEAQLLAPIAARLATHDTRKAEEAAATRVDFFTMVRGED